LSENPLMTYVIRCGIVVWLIVAWTYRICRQGYYYLGEVNSP
jgi:hypothetical protein